MNAFTRMLMATLTLPDDAQLLSGRERQHVGRLDGNGGSTELAWLILAPGGGQAVLQVASPNAGSASVQILLEAGGE